MAAKSPTPKRKTPPAGAKKSAGNQEEFDLKAMARQARAQTLQNKARIEAGETFASGRRGGREGSPSANRNRWYG
ncbi:hypothetical protein BKA03_002523 [Demequina lutea]|uniref:Uncharacterized protein n=1 Tax=Demequina lutea TaxID=431489 RepID=A0A7Z0CIW9_9MICO|nr:hypothetical protein [Demequina lutea]